MDTEDALLIPLDKAAARLGIPEHTLADKVRTKAIAHRRVGRRVYFTDDDLAAFINAAAVTPAPKAGRGRAT